MALSNAVLMALTEVITLATWSQVALALSCVLLGAWALAHRRRYAGGPPGPRGLPLVGYAPFVSDRLHLDFNRLAERYGDVFSLFLGSRYYVVLNSYDVLKEAFIKDGDVFAGKPKDGVDAEFGDHRSVFVTDGTEWKEQRRFLLSTLRDFGFGKAKLEKFVQEEAQLGCQELRKWGQQVKNARHFTVHMTGNVIAQLAFCKSFPYDDSSLTDLMALFDNHPSDFPLAKLLNFYPGIIKWLGFLPPIGAVMEQLNTMKRPFYDFCDKMAEEHEKTFDPSRIRDVLDVYLLKFQELEKHPELRADPVNAVYTKEHMRANIVLLFMAGLDTTATTLAWTLRLLAANPRAQSRVQAEIDDVVGREQAPETADRQRMPYTEAALLEAHRRVSLVTFTLPHRITDETKLRGYRIPQNAFVLGNLWNIHHNPATWDDPMAFRPERFLGPDGKLNDLRECVIPFSIGKRNCLGESLAKMELFVFLTTFLQQFSFHPPNGLQLNNEPDQFFPTAIMKDFDLCVSPRP